VYSPIETTRDRRKRLFGKSVLFVHLSLSLVHDAHALKLERQLGRICAGKPGLGGPGQHTLPHRASYSVANARCKQTQRDGEERRDRTEASQDVS